MTLICLSAGNTGSLCNSTDFAPNSTFHVSRYVTFKTLCVKGPKPAKIHRQLFYVKYRLHVFSTDLVRTLLFRFLILVRSSYGFHNAAGPEDHHQHEDGPKREYTVLG